MRRRALGAPVLWIALGVAALGPHCLPRLDDPGDPMLDGDFFIPRTGRVLELLPGVPWVLPGPDQTFGTVNDVVVMHAIGDVDIVLRTGITGFAGAIPDPSPLRGAVPEGVAEPFGTGTPVDFVVTATDGLAPPAAGAPVAPPSLEGVPVLVAAFADLDGDGFVGITALDGDPFDAEIEEAELDAVGRRFALAQAGRAAGSLHLSAGGPAGAPLRVVLAAAAYTGPFDPGFFGGAVPDGPAVMTRFPFLPRTDPNQVIEGNLPGLADPGDLVGVQIEDEFTPDPLLGRYGEALTVSTDGSEVTLDVAEVRSGAFSRFGLARPPDPASYVPEPGRPLRPGLDDAGARVLLEILERVEVLPGTEATPLLLRVVPLDRLGNVADPPLPALVTLRAEGGVRILAPDGDGDTGVEVLAVLDARGVAVQVDAAGLLPGASGGVIVESDEGIAHIDFALTAGPS